VPQQIFVEHPILEADVSLEDGTDDVDESEIGSRLDVYVLHIHVLWKDEAT